MFSHFSNGRSFDSAFSQNEALDFEREIKRVNRLYVISGVAIWLQQWNMVHLSESWGEVFGIPTNEIVLLEDYLALIENDEDRARIWRGRESLISQTPGFEWSDTFTLRDRTLQTTAIVAKGCIFGMDRVVGQKE